MSKQNNIPQLGNLPQDKLLAYLEGKLSPAEQREVEALLTDDGMDSDALEGLNSMSVSDAKILASRIDYKLQYDLKKKRSRKRSHFADNKWAWLAVMFILIMAVLGYMMIKLIM